ncbi:MAG: methylated-DNA--[protein]-cysteine S-methyltransferase [candidate division Zixibacteria bacterium]|nr:methylated-DNA--[protein]-cysteine S-methyltransferase [candidate division Zixibacteria bacterium]
MKKQSVYVQHFKTDWGEMSVAMGERGVVAVSLPGTGKKAFEAQLKNLPGKSIQICEANTSTARAAKELILYLKGRLNTFSIKIEIDGTPFQKKVLHKVVAIPYGKTRTYGEIAKAVGSPKAARAVGTVMANNRIPLIIPCHRVTAAGGLGGYAGGLRMKKRLLELEKENAK